MKELNELATKLNKLQLLCVKKGFKNIKIKELKAGSRTNTFYILLTGTDKITCIKYNINVKIDILFNTIKIIDFTKFKKLK